MAQSGHDYSLMNKTFFQLLLSQEADQDRMGVKQFQRQYFFDNREPNLVNQAHAAAPQ